jgi:hypothetical protein
MVGLGLTVWFGLTVRWATQPLSDTQSIGRNPQNELVYRTTECGAVVDSSPTGGVVVPAPVTPPEVLAVKPPLPAWEFARPPCELVHQHSRIVFVIDIVAFALGIGALAFVAARTRPHVDAPVSSLPA